CRRAAGRPRRDAWVIGRPAPGHGYAKEAAHSLASRLQAAGRPVTAYIHPGHLASQRMARAAGLAPAGDARDGEIRCASPPANGALK
ncbi:MAG: GNAT family N-acetyltransferase, partial [Actinobacteria bacterium]|nr:GNAT family N-acetyltransferase [Actinomycetota bacterium]